MHGFGRMITTSTLIGGYIHMQEVQRSMGGNFTGIRWICGSQNVSQAI